MKVEKNCDYCIVTEVNGRAMLVCTQQLSRFFEINQQTTYKKLNIKYPEEEITGDNIRAVARDFQDVEDASFLSKAIWRTTRGCNKLR